jgi:hypothetical protein
MAVDINGDGLIALGGTSTTQGRLRLAEDTDNGTNYIELTANAAVTTNRTVTFPDETGTVITTATTTGLNASAISSGTLAVAQGGTGASTLTANNVIIGNGTSAVTFVAPGTAGNVLTSNGTVWASTAAPTPSSSVGAVGTYALLRNANNTTLNAGDTVTGGLEYANSGGSSSGSASGTWRCMGYTEGGAGNARITTLFLRIS